MLSILAALLMIASAPTRAEFNDASDADGKMARNDELERVQGEIDAELKRQEALQRTRDLSDIGRALQETATDEDNLEQRADTRLAPNAPADRNLPVAIFDSEEIEVPPGTIGNAETMIVIQRTLDADRDDHPEQIRYIDKATGQMFRKEADRDYDGAIDTWQSYVSGSLEARTLDTNGDGSADTWEKYQAGRMTERIIDRNGDGRQDAFYTYSGLSLVEEKHDRNDDGEFDHVVTYQGRRKTRSREDRSGDGNFDTWTTYAVVNGKDLPSSIKRDSNASGKVDIIETYETASGKPVVSKREEDTTGDGAIDVTSIYRNGKLHRKEFADPILVTD
jgi:hypothetical protein